MRYRRREFLQLAAAAAALPAMSRVAPAQTQVWPAKQIRAIVPVAPGSTIDIISRIVFEPLSRQLGQPIIIDNRAGAGTTIGSAVVARAEPDGYTLLVNSSAHAATPAIYPNAPYDTARDFAAVASLGSSPNVVVVSPAKGIKTLAELVAAARVRPGAMSYGSVGVGSAVHISTELLRLSAGFEAVHVPFRGMPEALTEVMTERVDFACSSIAAGLPFIREGKLLALAVSTPQRSSALPDVPTTLELGFRDSEYTFWTGLFVPAKTPRDIIDKLHQEIQKALNGPGVPEKFAQQGVDPMPITPTAFDAQIKREIDAILAVTKAANLKFN
ncbi:MAG TPA: tripartite tricarboxylate transporter substrate binding protein [Xanthobacteraceae bacterium]|jgi:tripartite-type tricarboxylate transporter receptor subunit TctC|nr:tripartite tricarboxylate transporter substrate binding protein [Xanthobacteraceae bacterium]